ncbi:ParB/RepB/Spo0J family partition protein [Streptomyces neyagawaensis]|uniref:ParB/RepB/Spo0J family partition protein n=1 Tax=Streptomyces neyagawaensis TaxID=42238 RepID=UPI00099F222A|nr:ParB N-terminal domain-containing protein [Streptomyces neyagawaensis]MCL6736845.1 ParB N-terminal domain-containing protein [Streptomyces neyagawaensis]MDE1684610.1 ParB N-terminal domain-containing protein [Streptomyces neyagawaensis]
MNVSGAHVETTDRREGPRPGLRLAVAAGAGVPQPGAAPAGDRGGPAGDRGGRTRRTGVVDVDALRASDSPRLGGENRDHVRTLAEQEEPLPPILVHHPTMRVIDGMHRLAAARLRGATTIEVEYFDGDEDEVFALSVELNIAHGLPLSQADRAAAAERILTTHPYWSDRRIASNAGLAPSTVAAIRRRSTSRTDQLNAPRVGRDGRVRPLQATEGRLRASQVIAANPTASLREIAERAGIATATAKDVRDRIRRGQDPVPQAPPARRVAARDEPGRGAGQAAGGARGTAHLSAAAIGLILPNICKDPSLRTEAGRMLLQMLSVHSIGDEAKWQRLARSVPGHRAPVLAQAARRCADHWLRLANELEMRRG